MANAPKDVAEAIESLQRQFGGRIGMLGFTLVTLSQTGQPCDVTFFHRNPSINARVGTKLSSAMIYGAGAAKIAEILNRIEFSDGTSASIGEIWTVNPMPKDGFTDEELAAVDLADGQERVGPNGETLRKMVSDTYHCASTEEEDKYLRRFIAS
jgi:hypothetical protein